MAQNKILKSGPAFVSNSAANIINCAITSVAGTTGLGTMTQPYLIIKHIRLVNKTSSAATVTLYIGATGASASGTEFLGAGLSIPANSAYDWYGQLKLLDTDYLTGVASASSTIVFQAELEIGFQ